MANAHKDSENKFLPPVRGRLFEKLLRRNVLKNVLRAHTLSKTTQCEKLRDVGLVLQRSCTITKVITLIPPPPPRKQSHTPETTETE